MANTREHCTFSIINKDCRRYALLYLPGKELKGITSDLSFLDLDFNDFHTLSVKTRDKKVYILYDNA